MHTVLFDVLLYILKYSYIDRLLHGAQQRGLRMSAYVAAEHRLVTIGWPKKLYIFNTSLELFKIK